MLQQSQQEYQPMVGYRRGGNPSGEAILCVVISSVKKQHTPPPNHGQYIIFSGSCQMRIDSYEGPMEELAL